MELDDYSMYNQLSDEELLQIAVERSLSNLSTASSLPPATPPPPSPPHASSGVNPPRAMSNFPYRAFR
ncbi:Ankyrin repeat and SOCS box protein 2, partial [Dissostichus eleginoides]